MQTMKQLIETGFFPTDDEGRALVPLVGGGDYSGNATIFATNAPGEYPIIGTEPRGYAAMWSECGTARREFFAGLALHGDDVLACSLRMPEVEEVTFRVIIDDGGYVVDTYDAGDEPLYACDIPEGGQVVEATGFRYVPAVAEPTAGNQFSVSDEDVDDLNKAVRGLFPEVPFGGIYGMPIGINYSHGIVDRSR